MTEHHPAAAATLEVGTQVEVRGGIDGAWSGGFVVDERSVTGYHLKRRSDHEVLPEEIPAIRVRRERKTSMWWV